jgi:hypothetical protein
MKKTILILIVSALFLLVVGCNEHRETDLSYENANIDVTKEFEFTDINEVVEMAEFIVIGEIVNEEEILEGSSKYSIKVDEVIKGIVEDTHIDVYELSNSFEISEKAILFLNGWADPLYPDPLYTSLSMDTIFKISGEQLSGNQLLLASNNKEKFINQVKEMSKKYAGSQKKVEKVISKPTDTLELIELSQHVIHIKVAETVAENKYVKFVAFEKIDEYKGDLRTEIDKLALPSFVQEGKEYLVFMNEVSAGVFNLTTNQGSVISKKESAEWNAALKILGE